MKTTVQTFQTLFMIYKRKKITKNRSKSINLFPMQMKCACIGMQQKTIMTKYKNRNQKLKNIICINEMIKKN